MPLFEFACQDCGKRFTYMVGVVADNEEPRCPQCQSAQLKKLISRVVRGRSDEQRMDSLATRLEEAGFDDERSVRKFARQMGKEMGAETGEDLSDEFEAMMQEESQGQGGGGSRDDGTIY